MYQPITTTILTLIAYSIMFFFSIAACIILKIEKMKKETITGIVIYTEILGKKKFISSTSTQANNRILPQYSEQEKEAKPFLLQHEADAFISRINNIHNRQFKTMHAEIDPKDIASVKFPKQKAA